METAKNAVNSVGEAAGNMAQSAQSAVGLGGKQTGDDVPVPEVDTNKAKNAVAGHGEILGKKGGADAKDAAADGDVKGAAEGVADAAKGVAGSVGTK
ncbi:unnamed protein product [Pylaiella littoralis]